MMDSRGNDRLREMLAAEYALGTLRGGARRRFERWMRSDRELQTLAFAWSERLTPLIDAVAPRTPPQRVWEAIEARLPGFAAGRGAPSSVAPTAWWNRLGLWRGMSAAFAVVAAVAIAIAIRPVPSPETQFVQVETIPGAVATVTDPKSGAVVAMVMASREGDQVIVDVKSNVQVGRGQALQLWLSPNGKDMVSMGMLPTVKAGVPIVLKPTDVAALANAKAIGLSLEPEGGSSQPTNVLGLGALIRVSS
jgi:anti-sigma-K factor RskA